MNEVICLLLRTKYWEDCQVIALRSMSCVTADPAALVAERSCVRTSKEVQSPRIFSIMGVAGAFALLLRYS
jgi:hypothetical protein